MTPKVFAAALSDRGFDRCRKQAVTLIKNWPIRVNECNGDVTTATLAASKTVC
jgi:hypothetical protein